MSESDLGARQGAILTAIVQEFIRSGEPVGSKHLVGRFQLTVSSATVRNDMSRLEEMGYLAQPHTSAGRVPTDLGYRFFVDNLREPVALDEGRERALEQELTVSDIEELLQRSSEVLSTYTKQAAAVLAPRLTDAKLRHLDLVRLSPQLALLVVVVDTGRVEKRVIEFDADIAPADLEKAQTELNKLLPNARLSDCTTIANALAEKAAPKQKPVLSAVSEAIGDVVREGSRVFVGGAANLAAKGDFVGESEALPRIIEAFERQTKIMRLLAGGLGEPMTVQIGSEVPDETLQACSIVMSSYAVDGTPLGTVGVIGPTRMDYTQAMALTKAVARSIQEHIEAISG